MYYVSLLIRSNDTGPVQSQVTQSTKFHCRPLSYLNLKSKMYYYAPIPDILYPQRRYMPSKTS